VAICSFHPLIRLMGGTIAPSPPSMICPWFNHSYLEWVTYSPISKNYSGFNIFTICSIFDKVFFNKNAWTLHLQNGTRGGFLQLLKFTSSAFRLPTMDLK